VATAVPSGPPPPMGQAPLPSSAAGPPPLTFLAPTYYPGVPPGTVFVPSTIVRDRDRTVTGLLLLVIGIALSWIPYVSFLGAILAFVGIILVILGRFAYGEEHHRYVVAGGVLFVVTILASVGLAIGLVAALAGQVTVSGSSVSLESGALQSDFQAFFIGAAVVGIIGGLSRVIMVYGLSDRTTRILLWAGFVSSIALSIVVLLILYPQIVNAVNQATSGSTVNTGPITNLQTEATLLGLTNILPSLLFAWAYWRVREEAINRTASPAY